MDSDEAVEFYDRFIGDLVSTIHLKLEECSSHIILLELEIPPRLEILLALLNHMGVRVKPDYLANIEARYVELFEELATEDGWIDEDIEGRVGGIRECFASMRSRRYCFVSGGERVRYVCFELRPEGDGMPGGIGLLGPDGDDFPISRFREPGSPFFCRDCRAFRNPQVPRTVVMATPPAESDDLTFVFSLCAVVSARLVQLLGADELRATTHLIPIVTPAGPCASHFAYWPAAPVLVRGNQSSASKRCRECGVLHYRGEGDRYILRADAGFARVSAAQKGFLVDQSLLPQIEALASASIKVTPIGVRTEPSDGLPTKLPYRLAPGGAAPSD